MVHQSPCPEHGWTISAQGNVRQPHYSFTSYQIIILPLFYNHPDHPSIPLSNTVLVSASIMDYGDDAMGDRRSRRKNSRYQDFANAGSDLDEEEEDIGDDADDEIEVRRMPRAPMVMKKAGRPKKSSRNCPSCDEPVKPSATVCEYCDYVFTSATRAQDDTPVGDRFPFEAERVSCWVCSVQLWSTYTIYRIYTY